MTDYPRALVLLGDAPRRLKRVYASVASLAGDGDPCGRADRGGLCSGLGADVDPYGPLPTERMAGLSLIIGQFLEVGGRSDADSFSTAAVRGFDVFCKGSDGALQVRQDSERVAREAIQRSRYALQISVFCCHGANLAMGASGRQANLAVDGCLRCQGGKGDGCHTGTLKGAGR